MCPRVCVFSPSCRITTLVALRLLYSLILSKKRFISEVGIDFVKWCCPMIKDPEKSEYFHRTLKNENNVQTIVLAFLKDQFCSLLNVE